MFLEDFKWLPCFGACLSSSRRSGTWGDEAEKFICFLEIRCIWRLFYSSHSAACREDRERKWPVLLCCCRLRLFFGGNLIIYKRNLDFIWSRFFPKNSAYDQHLWSLLLIYEECSTDERGLSHKQNIFKIKEYLHISGTETLNPALSNPEKVNCC